MIKPVDCVGGEQGHTEFFFLIQKSVGRSGVGLSSVSFQHYSWAGVSVPQ